MEKEIRLSFFKRLKMSIFDFDKYHIIASEGIGRAMMYLVKLMLLFSLIISFVSTVKLSQVIDNAIGYVRDNVPNFYFKDNILTIEEDKEVVIENHDYINFKIILSNANSYNEDEIRNFDGMVCVLLKDKMFLKQENSTSIITQTYEEISNTFDINQINKDFIINDLKGQNGYAIITNIFAVIFIATFLSYFMVAILDTIALSLLGFIVSRVIKMPLKYAPIYSISISAITLSIIINLIYMIINLFTGFIIPYFQIMYTLVSYVYLIAALLIMKSEIIKKKVKIQVEILNSNKIIEENKEQEKKEEENKKEEKDNDIKNKVEGKINNKDDKPEPQANIQEK